MVYIEIPFTAENNRVSKTTAECEIQILDISNDAKAEIFEAIYHRRPNGVSFEDKEIEQILLLENILRRLGIPYRQIAD